MAKRLAPLLVLFLFFFVLFESPHAFHSAVAVTSVSPVLLLSNGPVFIKADGSIDPISAPMQRNGSLYILTGDIFSFSGGIIIETDRITLDGAGHTVQGLVNSSTSVMSEGTGLNLTGRSEVTIENVTVVGFANGIALSSSSGSSSEPSNSDTIVGNNLTMDGTGVSLANSSDCHIQANVFSNDIFGVNIAAFSTGNSVESNDMTSDGLGVYLTASSGNNVYGNRISGFSDGIRLDSSSNNNVTLNSVTSNDGYGIILNNASSYNAVLENNVTDNDEGLTLRAFSNHNNVVENYVEGNYRGLEFIDSTNNTIARNNIADSGWFNFRFLRCFGNTVYENSLTGNYDMLWLDSSSNNTFYHNFIGNTGVFLAPSTHNNVWDNGYPSGGNYWVGSNTSDQFSGTYQNITGADGICDNPVALDANDTDHYPLAGPFSSYNATFDQQIQMASNSTISNFNFNDTAIRFEMTGEDGTNGFCRICIPSNLINGTLTVLANGTRIEYAVIPGSNSTVSYLYFSLHFSTQAITILPEHLSIELLLVFMFTTALATLVYKKKH